MATPTRYPGWRHMSGAQRYNARMDAMFERAKALQAEQAASETEARADLERMLREQSN